MEAVAVTDGAGVFYWPRASPPPPPYPESPVPQPLTTPEPLGKCSVIVFTGKQLAALKIYLVML